MKIKFILLLLLVILHIQINAQTITKQNLIFNVPVNFSADSKEEIDKGKKQLKNDPEYSKYIERFDALEFNQITSFYNQNKECKCTNTFQYMIADYSLRNENSEFTTGSEITKTVIEGYNSNLGEKMKSFNSIGEKMRAISFSNPKLITTKSGINVISYQLTSEEMKLSTNKMQTYVTDNFIIPQKDFFTLVFFHIDKNNYENIKPAINKFLDSLKVKK